VLAVGLALAWRIDSIAGFHGVMNLVLLPGWLLSGALFPQESAAPWLGTIMLANPLLWANRAIGSALGTMPPAGGVAWMVTLLFPVLATLFLLATVRRSGGLRGSGEG
jgi:ABC-2 type transport system permease protein